MERQESEVVAILDRATLLEKVIKFQTLSDSCGHRRNKIITNMLRMENWKDVVKEEDWASKVRLITVFFMGWEPPKPVVMLEFFEYICD